MNNQSDSNLVSSAEQILGYHFRKPSLLKHALTHASYSNGTISYQLLEFVGDSALNLAMTNYLNVSYKNLRPGDICTLRSANVSNEKLARVAVRHNIYPLVRINCPKLDKMVKKFTKAVKQEPEDEIYGGSTIKAPKVLADVVEAVAAAIYQDCNNLDIMWEVVKRHLEPLITPNNFAKHKVTALTQFCEKNGKDLKFDSSRKGKTTIFEVLVDNEKVGYGSSKNKCIAKLNAARDALQKLNGEKSKHNKHIVKLNAARNALKKLNREKPMYIAKLNAARNTLKKLNGEKSMYMAKLNAATDALEKLNREKSNLLIKLHKEVEDKKAKYKSVLESRDTLEKLNREKSNLLIKLHKEVEDKEAKYKSVLEARDTLEKLNREKSNLLIKLHKEVEDKEAKHKFVLEARDALEKLNREKSNVTVEGRERRERRFPCCGVDNGWLLFILGFFLFGIPWCIGAIIYFSRVDYREKPGYICCAKITVGILAIICWDIIKNWSHKKELMMTGDFMLL